MPITYENERLVADLKVGDIFTYCGCRYEITYIEKPDVHSVRFMSCIKSHMGKVLSEKFHMCRHYDDKVFVITNQEETDVT